MNILIYFPTNSRAIDVLSVMDMLITLGHNVSLLTFAERGDLHTLSDKLGVRTFSHSIAKNNALTYYSKHAKFLIQFCNEQKIDVIFSHLQDTGLPCALALPFLKAKVFYIRHNTDEGKLISPKKSAIMNAVINRVLPTIISPSNTVYKYLTEVEKVSPKKIISLNYGYDFNQYQVDKTGIADEIRNKYKCKMLVVSVCRLTGVKRHNLMLEAIETLLNEGLDIKWVCIGRGDLLEYYQNLIQTKNLSDKVFFLGFTKNVADYLEAADVFLHLSETEASNSAVKEAALEKLSVIVCNNVGDFDDYVETGVNGFIVNKENPVPETIKNLKELYDDPTKLNLLGENLNQTVIKEFSIENVKSKYEELLKSV